jgi:uncharacterized protein YhhL (DUF1145 family)
MNIPQGHPKGTNHALPTLLVQRARPLPDPKIMASVNMDWVKQNSLLTHHTANMLRSIQCFRVFACGRCLAVSFAWFMNLFPPFPKLLRHDQGISQTLLAVLAAMSMKVICTMLRERPSTNARLRKAWVLHRLVSHLNWGVAGVNWPKYRWLTAQNEDTLLRGEMLRRYSYA